MSTKNKLSFSDVRAKFYEHNKQYNITGQYEDKKPLYAVVVFSQNSFRQKYPLKSRSYRFRSDENISSREWEETVFMLIAWINLNMACVLTGTSGRGRSSTAICRVNRDGIERRQYHGKKVQRTHHLGGHRADKV